MFTITKLNWRLGAYLLGAFWALYLSGCSGDEGPEDLRAGEEQMIEQFLTANDIDAAQDTSGVYYYPIELNPTGRSQTEGNVLSIYYTLSVLDGAVVERYTADNGDPIRLRQGASAVYPVGLDLGLAFMKEGETFGFILPSDLAYGSFSFSNLIPANAIIMVEVELVVIENDEELLELEADSIKAYIDDQQFDDDVTTTDSGLRRITIEEGITGSILLTGDRATISYTGTFLDDEVFDATTGNELFEFTMGSGQIIAGLEEGVRSMERGETAVLIMPSNIGYGESARVLPTFLVEEFVENRIIPDYAAQVPPFEVLVFEVMLRQ